MNLLKELEELRLDKYDEDMNITAHNKKLDEIISRIKPYKPLEFTTAYICTCDVVGHSEHCKARDEFKNVFTFD